jgi:hypothetical protein
LATVFRQKKPSFSARLSCRAGFGIFSLMGDDKKKADPKRKDVKKRPKRMASANKADKTELYGESMEMLGEDLAESNAKLGGEAKNDELGQAAAEAMRALLKNKKDDAKD